MPVRNVHRHVDAACGKVVDDGFAAGAAQRGQHHVFVVAVSVSGDAHGVDAVGVDAVQLRVLDEQLFHQHGMWPTSETVQGAGVFIGGVSIDADAVPLAVAGGLEHYAAMLF